MLVAVCVWMQTIAGTTVTVRPASQVGCAVPPPAGRERKHERALERHPADQDLDPVRPPGMLPSARRALAVKLSAQPISVQPLTVEQPLAAPAARSRPSR